MIRTVAALLVLPIILAFIAWPFPDAWVQVAVEILIGGGIVLAPLYAILFVVSALAGGPSRSTRSWRR